MFAQFFMIVFLMIIAISTVDHTSMFVNVVFPTGSSNDTRKCINITITDDSEAEENETFHVLLCASNSAILGNNETIITVIDDDGKLY